jgi:hypothetical protein
MTITLTRRQVLELAMVGAAAAAPPSVSVPRQPFAGRILGLCTLDPADGRNEVSRLVELDLVTGAVDYHDIGPYKFGHSLLKLPGGGYYATPYGDDEMGALFLDDKFRVTGEVKAPAGHGYGGHSVILPNGKNIFGHFNRTAYEEKLAPEDTGRTYLLDIESRSVVESKPSDVLHGHDMLVTRDGRYIVVGDDGTIETRFGDALFQNENPFSLIPGEPQFVVFDATTLEQKRRIPLDINGAVVHIAEDNDGFIYGAVEQYVANNTAGHQALNTLLGDGAEKYVEMLDEELLADSQELPYPGPLLRTNLATGKVEEHVDAQNQMPFDVKLNSETGRVFHVFTQSNILAQFDPLRNRWTYFSTETYGIEMPYGLTDVPGTNLMVVNGFHDGMAVFDTTSMAMVKKFETKNFGIKHLMYEAG